MPLTPRKKLWLSLNPRPTARRGAAAKLLGFGVCAGLALLASLQAPRAEVIQSVVAVVNDEAISRYDLEQRMRLVLSSSGMPASGDTVRRIEPQVLRSLVDEHLQLQEAKKKKITINDDEVDQALGMIAQQNNMSADQIGAFMAKGNIDVATLKDQIRAEMAWQRLVGERFGARVYVSESDLKTEYQRFVDAMSHPQYLLSEIFLPIENPDQEQEVAASAQGVIADLKRGAPFSSLARQFSKSTSAAAGGDLGWVQTGQLDQALDKTISTLAPGQISEPILTAGGYRILYLRNKREGGTTGVGELKHVHLKQIVIPLAAKAPEEAVQKAEAKAREVAADISGCASVDRLKSDPTVSVSDFGDLAADQISPSLRQAIAGLETGEAGPALRSPMGLNILVVCNKSTGPAPKAAMPTMEDVENRMVNQQLSMMSRRYLRDLRRDAVVEYRTPQTN